MLRNVHQFSCFYIFENSQHDLMCFIHMSSPLRGIWSLGNGGFREQRVKLIIWDSSPLDQSYLTTPPFRNLKDIKPSNTTVLFYERVNRPQRAAAICSSSTLHLLPKTDSWNNLQWTILLLLTYGQWLTVSPELGQEELLISSC